MAADVDPQLPTTEKVYLKDTYNFLLDGVQVLQSSAPDDDVEEAADGKKGASAHCIILDRSIFHPQGGGQPSDQGTIEGCSRDSKGVKFLVDMVRDVKGVMHHFGKYENDAALSLHAGDEVRLQVDESKRRLHARLHSAGHAIDVAVTRGGYADYLKPTKGYHFIDGPYVEYQGTLPVDKTELFIEDLNHHLDVLIKEGMETQVHVLPKKAAGDLLGGNEEDLAHLPDDRDVRIVSVAGQACPCGGTHVKRTTELGAVQVTKFKAKKNVVKVSYKID